MKKEALRKHQRGATMTHVNLDTQPELIRQFLLDLSASGEGAILESAGRPVACVVPQPRLTTEAGGRDGEWTEEKNRRRGALLDNKYDHGLSPAEEAELALLQDAMHRYIDRVAPLPLDAARSLHQEVLQKAAQAQNARHA